MHAWCSTDEAAEHFGISRDKFVDAVADSVRAGIKVPDVDHGTAKKPCRRYCVALLDTWMMEVAAWRRSVASTTNTKSAGEIPHGQAGKSTAAASRIARTRSRTSRSSRALKSGASSSPMRDKLRLLESTTP